VSIKTILGVHFVQFYTAAAAISYKVWGKTLLIGGGKKCQMLQKDFITRVLNEVGIGMLPESAFTGTPFYTDWMDTSRSQKILKGIGIFSKRLVRTSALPTVRWLGISKMPGS